MRSTLFAALLRKQSAISRQGKQPQPQENKDYNGSQETQLTEQHPETEIARDLRQLCDWLQEHRREKLI